MSKPFYTSFLDNNFPKEYKDLFFKLENLIMKRVNCRSYNIFYSFITNDYDIAITFENFRISVFYSHKELKNIDENNIFNCIKYKVITQLEKIYFNDEDEE